MDETEDLNYAPKNPLPEELKKMPQDEAACKYCGVSYLILSEVQRLRNTIAAMEREMASLRKSGERERALMDDIQRLTVQQKELVRQLELARHEHAMMQSELQEKRDECQRVQMESMDSKTRMNEMAVDNSNLSSQLSNFRGALSALSNQVSELRSAQRNAVHVVEQSKATIPALLNDVARETRERVAAFLEEQRQFVNTRLQAAECERETLRSESQHLSSVKDSMNAELASLRHAKSELLKQVSLTNDEKVRVEKELEAANAAWRHKLNELDAKLKSVQKDRDELTNERAALTQKLGDVEKQNASQSHNVRSFVEEKEHLANQLRAAREELNSLRDERGVMVTSHQNRIEQLRASYEERVKKLEAASQELQARLDDKEAERSNALHELQLRLRADFDRSFEIERQKSTDLIERYKREAQFAGESAKALTVGEHTKYKDEIASLQQSLKAEKEQFGRAVAKHNDELAKARTMIDQLQAQLERATIERNRQDGELTVLRRERDRFDDTMHQSRKQLTMLEDELDAAKSEVRTLQNMVQRECEERLELADALQNAKEQLLALKLPINIVNTSSRSGQGHGNPLLSSVIANGQISATTTQISSRHTSASSGVIDPHRSAPDSQSESGTSNSSAKHSNVTLRPIKAAPRRTSEVSPEEVARRRILAAMSRPKF